jgi:hypothetical protein
MCVHGVHVCASLVYNYAKMYQILHLYVQFILCPLYINKIVLKFYEDKRYKLYIGRVN